MPTLISEDKFETGGTWNVSAGTPTIVSSPAPPSSTRSLQLDAIGEYVYWNIPDNGYTRCVFGVWIYVNALPASDSRLFKIDAGPSEGWLSLHLVNPNWDMKIESDGVPNISAVNGGTVNPIQTWTWCQIMYDVSANPWEVRAKIGTTVVSVTGAAAATNLNPGVFLLGNTAGGSAATIYFGHAKMGVAIDDNDWWATPTGTTTPTAPQSLQTGAGDSQVALSWTAPASDGGSAITAYKIYRSTTTGAETLFASPAGTGTSYVDATTVNGTTYFYKVSAVNAIGESALSNEASATPASASVARTFKRFYGPALLGNAAATLYTCPPSAIAVVRHVHVSNPTGSAVDFTLSIGTSAAGTRIWDAQPIPADDQLDHYQEFTLTAGEIIQGLAGSASTLNLTIDGYEVGADLPIYPGDAIFPHD